MAYGVKPELSKDNIYERVSPYHIFKFYCNYFKELNTHFYSEFRKEGSPSCCIALIGGDLLYKDFGTGESHRAISYVMNKYNLTFPEAMQKINVDFNLDLLSTVQLPEQSSKGKGESLIKTLKIPDMEEKANTIIRIKRREFSKKDLTYWSDHGWTIDMLKSADIFSISHYWIKNYKGHKKFITGNNLAFSYDYYWSEGTFRRKLYFPGNGKKKSFFLSNVDNTIVQGVKLLPKKGGKLLIITSSLKDCGPFWRLGYHAVAPNNEGSFLPEKYYNKVRIRWENMILWYNNDWMKEDNPGITCAKKYSDKYGLDYYYNPDNEPKDPSDFVKQYGLYKFETLVKSKLDKYG